MVLVCPGACMTFIRDSKGRNIGMIKDAGSIVVALDYRGNQVGYFSKSLNRTFDSRGLVYSIGNDATVALVHASSPYR